MKKVIAVCVLAVSLSSCYSVKSVSTNGATLANETETLPNKVEKKHWYAVWGLAPLGDKNKTTQIIQDNGFNKVRIESKMTFTDVLISLVTSWVTIVPMTITVEGEK